VITQFEPGPLVRLPDGSELRRDALAGLVLFDTSRQVFRIIQPTPPAPPPLEVIEPPRPRLPHLKEVRGKFARFPTPRYVDSGWTPTPVNYQHDAQKVITCVAELLPWEQEYRMAGLVS